MADTEHDKGLVSEKPADLLTILNENALTVIKKELHKVPLATRTDRRRPNCSASRRRSRGRKKRWKNSPRATSS